MSQQSAYRKLHGTERALIRIHNDIATALDQKRSVILLLLDLSAAFGTVDHCILLSRLSRRFGIGGTALEWFRSYLGDRTQFVNINGSISKRRVLQFGEPEGSVLGPLLYSLYTSPLSDIASEQELSFTFMRMTRSFMQRSRRHPLMIWNYASVGWKSVY